MRTDRERVCFEIAARDGAARTGVVLIGAPDTIRLRIALFEGAFAEGLGLPREKP